CKAIELSFTNRGNLFVAQAIHSAPGRIGVDSKRGIQPALPYVMSQSHAAVARLWPSGPRATPPETLNQNRRGTRAWIFCGVRSRPSILRTFLNTCRIKKDVCCGSIPSIRAIFARFLSELDVSCDPLGATSNIGKKKLSGFTLN